MTNEVGDKARRNSGWRRWRRQWPGGEALGPAWPPWKRKLQQRKALPWIRNQSTLGSVVLFALLYLLRVHSFGLQSFHT